MMKCNVNINLKSTVWITVNPHPQFSSQIRPCGPGGGFVSVGSLERRLQFSLIQQQQPVRFSRPLHQLWIGRQSCSAALRRSVCRRSGRLPGISPVDNKEHNIIVRPRRSRSAAAYSRQTFPWTICRSVRTCVGRSVGLSSALWKNGGSDLDAVWCHRSDGSRDEAGGGVWGSVTVVIQGQIWWCQTWRRPARRLSVILQNFSPIAQTVFEMCVTQFFHFLTLGANP